MSKKPTQLTEHDFVGGLLAAAGQQGRRRFNRYNGTFFRAMEVVYQELCQLPEVGCTIITFRIRAHPIHGDSPTAQGAITSLVSEGFVRWSGGEIVLEMGEPDMDFIFRHNALSREVYEGLAARFLTLYCLPLSEWPELQLAAP